MVLLCCVLLLRNELLATSHNTAPTVVGGIATFGQYLLAKRKQRKNNKINSDYRQKGEFKA